VVVQGFGAVGKHSARFLADRGAILVAASDSQGAIHDPKGISVVELVAWKDAGNSVAAYPNGRKLDRDAVLDVECEIWIPAARPDVVRDDNVHRLKTKLVVSGANIPVTESAEQTLHQRSVTVIPDFIANAGGVICAAMEYHGATRTAAFAAIEEKIRENTKAVLEASRAARIPPRRAAVELATARIRQAMSYRRFSIL
jgi:glutamate dehydrogenase (NAD(P)+)